MVELRGKELEGYALGLEAGDVLEVASLEAMGLSTVRTITLIDRLKRRDVSVRTLDGVLGPDDTRMIAVLAALERKRRAKGTRKGREAAQHGKLGGRPPCVLDDPRVLRKAIQWYESGNYHLRDILQHLKVTRSTFFRYLKQAREKGEEQA